MALSDSCFDALSNLQDEFIHYSEWGYSPKELSKITKAMYELCAFILKQDLSPNMKPRNQDKFVDSGVIDQLIKKANATGKQEFIKVLADVAKYHTRLDRGIQTIFSQIPSEHYKSEIQGPISTFTKLNIINRITNY